MKLGCVRRHYLQRLASYSIFFFLLLLLLSSSSPLRVPSSRTGPGRTTHTHYLGWGERRVGGPFLYVSYIKA